VDAGLGIGDVEAAVVGARRQVVHRAEQWNGHSLQQPVRLRVVDFDLLRRLVTQHVQTVVQRRHAPDGIAFRQAVQHVTHCRQQCHNAHSISNV